MINHPLTSGYAPQSTSQADDIWRVKEIAQGGETPGVETYMRTGH